MKSESQSSSWFQSQASVPVPAHVYRRGTETPRHSNNGTTGGMFDDFAAAFHVLTVHPGAEGDYCPRCGRDYLPDGTCRRCTPKPTEETNDPRNPTHDCFSCGIPTPESDECNDCLLCWNCCRCETA